MTLEHLDIAIAFAVVMLGVSVLITVLTQAVSAGLGSRGTNLRWGIERVLISLDPKLTNQATALATTVLHNQLISDSIFSRFENWPVARVLLDRWKLATAIGSDELIRALRKIAANAKDLGISDETANALTASLDAPDVNSARTITMLKAALSTFGPGYNVQLDKVLQQVSDAELSVGKLEASFNTVMDRTSQRFAMQMRIWTIVFAFLLALGIHLDSFRLLDQLSSNPDMRAALVDIRGSMLNQATALGANQSVRSALPPDTVAPDVLNDAMTDLKKAEKDAAGLDEMPSASTVDQAVQWLNSNLPAGIDPGRKDALATEYRELVITVLKQRAAAIDKQLAQAGIQLIPKPYPGPFHWEGWRNLLGQLVTAALLSLGAPFWFNALKNLSNLRSAVANNQD